MSLKPVKVLLFTGLSLSGYTVLAQNIDRPFENNPYSRYGLGEEQNAINPALKAMGSITAAYQDPYTVNTDNPASYAHIKHFTYEAGGEGRIRTILSANEKYKTGNAAVSYLNLAIPMGKYAGMLVGFRPQTKVGYYLYDNSQTTLIGPSSLSYTGDGSTNYFFIGGAGTYKGFSLGANVGYIFGSIQQSSWLKTLSTDKSLSNSEFTRFSTVGGMYYKLGATYETSLGKDFILRVGAQANLQQDIQSDLTEFWVSHPFYASDTTGSDTALYRKGVKEKITLPSSYTGGIQLAKSDKWMIGVNYKTTDWSKFNNQNIPDSVGSSAYKLSIGGEVTPNSLNLYKYFQRVTYRAGFYYGQDFVQINGKQASYYALTFGLSLPIRRSTDRIHTAFEIGKMGDKSPGNIQQNFIRFSLGLSLSDKSWFVKRKYE
ncbi:MAG TPA: hypothetical protein VL092_03305 [Chitinophagaceae bacterium]|nr:hypothetical protein [Chitinophagaceae bacterium]